MNTDTDTDKSARAMLVMMITLLLVAIPGSAHTATAARAQQPGGSNGSICVLAFDDTNHNGVRDPGEAPEPDVNIDLKVEQGMIIANYVTDGSETTPHCFTNLTPQQYTVSFSSPLYAPTTSATFTFVLSPGEQSIREFGAVASATEAAPDATSLAAQGGLGTQQRLTLSALGSALMMVGLAGLGMIIAFFLARRR